MLTGFNTDIQHDGVVYHVQTEDKGPENPVLLSLVYVGGAILAAKRTHYAKDIEAGMSQADLQVKLEKQHKAILAVINRGRIRELIELRERQLREQAASGGATQTLVTRTLTAPVFSAAGDVVGHTHLLTAEFGAPLNAPETAAASDAPPARTERLVSAEADVDELLASDFEIPLPTDLSDDGSEFADAGQTKTLGTLDAFLHTVLASGAPEPAAAPEPPPTPGTSELSFPAASAPTGRSGTGGLARASSSEFSLDRILAEYTHGDALEEKLELRLLGAPALFAGETVTLQVEATRGGRRPLPGVSVIVKILGTAFKPQIHSAVSGIDGVATLTVTLPDFAVGSGAVVIQASSDAREAEIKQLIRRR
jgi:hypothetical protein